MSLKLDELRKRLLQQSNPEPNAGPAADTPASVRLSETGRTSEIKDAEERPVEPSGPTIVEVSAPKMFETLSPNGNSAAAAPRREEVPAPAPMPVRQNAQPMKGSVSGDELADAVAKVFEETKNFQGRLDEVGRMFSLVEQVGGSAEELFGPLRAFHSQLSQLAHSFGPMRAFQAQLAQMAETFEPMRVLHDQLAQVADSFKEHLGQLVRALDPAKEFRERILRLAATFDQAGELQDQFRELYSAFNATGSESETRSAGSGNGSRATLH
jgi:hypothetical protein